MKRKQLDANSCGVWLVAGICSHVLNPPELADREHAFDICYSYWNTSQNAINHLLI